MSDHKDSLPKVPQQIGDPISENLQKLAQLFPGVVKDGELDVEALREELGDFAEIQPGDEKYELNWAGKQAAKKKAFEPLLGKTLKFVPEESKDAETTENIYLEGDNLEGLKLIRQNYYGAIRIIYIDPPYNTGEDSFVYNDRLYKTNTESNIDEGLASATGERFSKNEKSSNRYHARWLSMMLPLLNKAKELLANNGFIIISIDDNECSNLKNLCDEIFGHENFVAQFIWKKKSTTSNVKDAQVSPQADYQLCYRKSANGRIKPRTTTTDERKYPESDKEGSFRTAVIEKKDSGGYKRDSMKFEILGHTPRNGKRWQIGQETANVLEAKNRFFWDGEKIKLKIYDFEDTDSFSAHPNILDHHGNSASAARLVNEQLFEIPELFDNPKPVELLKYFCSIILDKEDVILDFFSGSATTAHAVMQLNAEDGGKRKHIMMQLPEVCDPKSEAAKAGYTTIAEIGKERIRRAGEKIVAELREKKAALEKKGELALDDNEESNPYLANPDALDIGFKCFRIEDTKINWLKKDLSGGELVDVDISDKDRLDFVPGFTDLDVVYEIMLRQSSISLTEPICTLADIGKRTYLYGESYLICLEEDITKEMVEKLAQLEPTPLKFIFRDSAFGKDIAFKDTTFRRLNAEIAKHTEGEETYTVEFI